MIDESFQFDKENPQFLDFEIHDSPDGYFNSQDLYGISEFSKGIEIDFFEDTITSELSESNKWRTEVQRYFDVVGIDPSMIEAMRVFPQEDVRDVNGFERHLFATKLKLAENLSGWLVFGDAPGYKNSKIFEDFVFEQDTDGEKKVIGFRQICGKSSYLTFTSDGYSGEVFTIKSPETGGVFRNISVPIPRKLSDNPADYVSSRNEEKIFQGFWTATWVHEARHLQQQKVIDAVLNNKPPKHQPLEYDAHGYAFFQIEELKKQGINLLPHLNEIDIEVGAGFFKYFADHMICPDQIDLLEQ